MSPFNVFSLRHIGRHSTEHAKTITSEGLLQKILEVSNDDKGVHQKVFNFFAIPNMLMTMMWWHYIIGLEVGKIFGLACCKNVFVNRLCNEVGMGWVEKIHSFSISKYLFPIFYPRCTQVWVKPFESKILYLLCIIEMI